MFDGKRGKARQTSEAVSGGNAETKSKSSNSFQQDIDVAIVDSFENTKKLRPSLRLDRLWERNNSKFDGKQRRIVTLKLQSALVTNGDPDENSNQNVYLINTFYIIIENIIVLS